MDIDTYFREFMQLDLRKFRSIKHNRDNIVALDTEDSEEEDESGEW